jgi:hypothetical protein
MIAPHSEWLLWLRVALMAPLTFFVGALMFGWSPRSIRQWRLFSIGLVCFTVFCVVMICVFHYA